jgi:hypothetical protein
LEIIVIECCSTRGFPLEEACEHCYLIQSAISVAISYIISVYCEDYAGYFTVILSFLAFHFCSAYFIYLVSCIYEEEPVIPKIAESVREVPRAAEPEREVVTSPDEETLEDHDITEVQEPPQMTFSHKRNPAWARELIQDGEKYGVPEGTSR